MAERGLLGGESIVEEWTISGQGAGTLVLTTHRVWRERRALGSFGLTSLALDEVEWSGLERKHRPMLLVAAVLLALLLGGPGLYFVAQAAAMAGEGGLDSTLMLVCAMVPSIALVVWYFLSRSVELVVAAGTGTVSASVRGGDDERKRALAFIARVEEAAMRARAGGAQAAAAAP